MRRAFCSRIAFGPGNGVDQIAGFNTQDRIELRDGHFASFEAVMALTHQDGINTVIDLGTDAGDQFILLGAQSHTLQRNDFLV